MSCIEPGRIAGSLDLFKVGAFHSLARITPSFLGLRQTPQLNVVYIRGVFKMIFYFFPDSGKTLVNGIAVFINIWAVHRNPKYWGDDAEQFRPERFLEGSLRHPLQFIPFSYSLRNCAGLLSYSFHYLFNTATLFQKRPNLSQANIYINVPIKT